MKATQACALFLLILLLCPLAAQAGTLGPALSYNELLALVRQARDGDVLLVSGDLSATDEALVTPALLEITGDGKATLRHLHVQRFFHCLFKSLPARFFHGGRRIQHRAAHGSRRRRVGAIRPVFRGRRHIAHRRRQQRCRAARAQPRLHQPARRRSLRQHGGQCARRQAARRARQGRCLP